MLADIQKDLKSLGNPAKVKILQGFFKTGKGEYGEGDVFLGVNVPQQREIARKYINADLTVIADLLNDKMHEHRTVALLILVEKYRKADESSREKIVKFYLSNTRYINNWDMVDLSAYNIIGDYLLDKDRSVLYMLVKSKSLWERRIAIVSTYAFIRKNDLSDTLKISEILLGDTHDLIHKAVGWMLREAGKKSQPALEEFLNKHYKTMPRTALRYAIERFDAKKKAFYMLKS